MLQNGYPLLNKSMNILAAFSQKAIPPVIFSTIQLHHLSFSGYYLIIVFIIPYDVYAHFLRSLHSHNLMA